MTGPYLFHSTWFSDLTSKVSTLVGVLHNLYRDRRFIEGNYRLD